MIKNVKNLAFILAFSVFSLATITSAMSAKRPVLNPIRVSVLGTKLLVNGVHYEAKHIGYEGFRRFEFISHQWGICRCDPNNPGPNQFACNPAIRSAYDIDHSRIKYDLDLLKSMNANGIRTWTEPNALLLDELSDRKMMVAVGLILPWGDIYNDPVRLQAETNRIIAYVNTYKNHPAVLFWIMGNEIELHFSPGQAPIQTPLYFAFLERLAQAIKAADPNHPVATAVAFNPTLIQTYNNTVPSMDIWAVNTYPGNSFCASAANCVWTQFANMTQKPIYVSEYEVDSFFHTNLSGNFLAGFEDQPGHAQINANLAAEIRRQVALNIAGNPNARVIGGAYFLFNDQEWQSSGWQDACGLSPMIEQDGWNRPGHDNYDDQEHTGIFKNAPTTQNSNALQPKLLYQTLQQVYQ